MMYDDGESILDDDSPRILSLLMERILQQESAEMDSPHVLICHAVGTGIVSYQGPYPTGLHAAVAAEAEARLEGASGASLAFTIAPLLPHHEADG